jgi:hypothetical protein
MAEPSPEEVREREEDARLEERANNIPFEMTARASSTAYSSIGKSIAETAPGLVDKLVNPKLLEDNSYDGLIPSLNFGNFTDDPTGLITSLQATLAFDYMRSANEGWLTYDLAKKSHAQWTVDIESSKGRGADRIAKLFFSQEIGVTLKKEKSKLGLEK